MGLSIFPFISRADDDAPKIVEGQLAPDFTTEWTNGGNVTLSDLRGKNVVLYFYPKDDTPGCTKEAKAFRDTNSQFRKTNSIVLGVSLDSIDSHIEFVRKYSLNFALVSDPEGKIIEKYGAFKDNIFGKSALGVRRMTVLIDAKGVIRKIWPDVNPTDHPDEVSAYIRQELK